MLARGGVFLSDFKCGLNEILAFMASSWSSLTSLRGVSCRVLRSQRPTDLLFLGSQTVLDVVKTLSQLAIRASAFATRFPECLHWKYRWETL